MIASVRGTVIARGGGEVVVEAAGVGYRLAVSTQTLAAVPDSGEATLLTQLIVRDDAMHLYGFAREEERSLFTMLIGVQGVGPKVAQAALGGGPAAELLAAIAAGDAARFQTVPGIGKRTAERIIVELRDKVAGAVAQEIVISRGSDDLRSVAREALLTLGYALAEVDAMLEDAAGDTPEALIADALKAAR